MDYPKQWDELSKRERKKKIKELKRSKARQQETLKKVRNATAIIVVLVVVVVGYRFATQKTPEEITFEQKIDEVSLGGRIEEFEIEGANHIGAGQTTIYNTNPPTSGSHWITPASWKFNDKELPDEQLVHNIEHGGIWITYKGLNAEEVSKLKVIAKTNGGSVVITKREENDDSVVIASWGRMMRLSGVDEVLIQKYIDTYINQSPEKLAR